MHHQKQKKIQYDEFYATMSPLFDEVRAASPKELGEIKKRIHIHDFFGVTHDAVERFFRPEFARLNTYDDFHLAAMIETIGMFWVFIGRTLFPELADMVLTYIQHENGRVREAVRRTGEYVRMAPHDGGHAQKPISVEEYCDFLRRFAALARELRRDVMHSGKVHSFDQVRKLAPSPYKTACLLWERIAMRDVYGNWLSDAEMEALGMPIPEVWADEEDIDDDVWFEHETWEAVRDTLWKRQRNEKPEACRQALEQLDDHAHVLLQQAMTRLGYKKDDAVAVYKDIARVGTLQVGEEVLSRVYLQQAARHWDFTPDHMNEFVRAFQAAVNHAVFYDTQGHAYTHLLVACIQQRDGYSEKEPRSFSRLLEHLHTTHHYIETLCEKYLSCCESEYAHIEKLTPGLVSSDDEKVVTGAQVLRETMLANARYEVTHMASILHHICDWYVQVEPWAYIREDPERLVGKLFWIVRTFNEAHGRRCCTAVSPKGVAKFIGRAQPTSVRDNELYDLITASVRDPDLLLCPKHSKQYKEK